MKPQHIAALILVAVIGWLMFGRQPAVEPTALRVLAGSELKDVEPFLPQLEKDTGVRLKLDYIGTLDGAERLAQGEDYPLAWFSHAKYLELLEGVNKRIQAREKIALSPVVIGVRESLAKRFGWDRTQPSWSDLAARAERGELRFAMTNPTASNSGFSALIGLIASLSSDPEGFTLSDEQQRQVKGLFKGQHLTAGSSGWLAEAYARDQDRLDAIVNYESVLLQMNRGGTLKEPLTIIYPREGVVTADYPLLLLDPAQRAAYEKVVAWFRQPAIQKRLMEETDRRPIVPGVAYDQRFKSRDLIELPFPGLRSVVDRILSTYLDEQRPAAYAVFVLDLSGSMQGPRMERLKASLFNLLGADTSLTGQFARFRSREQIVFLPFRGSVEAPRTLDLSGETEQTQELERAHAFVGDFQASGGTAVFSALAEAYRLIAEAQRQQPGRYYSIVLMTDGVSNNGIGFKEFRDIHARLPGEARTVKTFPILFGESDSASMRDIAELTGGKVFDGTQNLAAAFKAIRGYQ
ncbi:MAG: substrate-binding and vWA domain-containing protein [Pseudomonadota bacterium]